MDRDFKNDLRLILAMIAWVVAMGLAYHFLVGCTRTVKSVVEVHDTMVVERVRVDTLTEHSVKTDTVYKAVTDTLREYKVVRDSVVLRDSVYVREKGDSVFVYKEKWRTKVELKHDTIYKARIDTAWVSTTDTLIVYKYVNNSDSVKLSKDSSELKVKEKRNVWGHLTLAGLLLALAAGCVWLIRKKGI